MEKYTLAIETSCDDTSISILEGIETISIKTFSQLKEHQEFGGVIPEVASRLHSKYIFKLIESAIIDSGITLNDIDRIAVTGGPGLVNTLQVGITVAKTLSLSLGIPIYDINHIEAHAYSPFIGMKSNKIPQKAIVLIASGGHSELLLKDGWEYKLLGKTRDDSIGEAYDKVSKLLKLGYPGGAILDRIATTTSEEEIECPVSRLEGYDLSYSGLKSSIANKIKDKKISIEGLVKGFQNAAVKQLVLKVQKAIEEFGVDSVIVGGGVSANSLLREELKKIQNTNIYLPKLMYTGDNAAMIGYLCAIKSEAGKLKESKLDFDAEPRRRM